MKTSQLLLSGLDITEDAYSFGGHFILSAHGKSKSVDISNLESCSTIEEIKKLFSLDESLDEIKNHLMTMVVENAHIGSKIIEGENFEETIKKKRVERMAKSLDMA